MSDPCVLSGAAIFTYSLCVLPHLVMQRPISSAQSCILHSFSSQNIVLDSSLISCLLKITHSVDVQSSKV